MVKIKQEPPSPAAAEPTTKKRTRTSSREASAASAAAAAAEVVVKSEVKTEAEAEAGLKKEDGDVGDGAGLLAKLKASWATLDTTSTASEESPYPKLARPHPMECFLVNDALTELHGEPIKKELEADCAPQGATLLEKRAQSVLDSLVRTILSQNTTDKLSLQAFTQLKQLFPTWKAVLAAVPAKVEAAIKIGGLAQTKVQRIRAILETILEERPRDCPGGEPSLEWLRELSTEEVKAQLSRFKGVGPKTISCVLMFTIGSKEEFPVDTHVLHIAKRLGWVPPSAGRVETYAHLNGKIPDAIKYSLHVLLVRHGKACRACSKGTLQLPEVGPCPLTALANGGKLRPAVVALAEELGVGGGKGAGEAGAGGGKSKKAKVIKKEV